MMSPGRSGTVQPDPPGFPEPTATHYGVYLHFVFCSNPGTERASREIVAARLSRGLASVLDNEYVSCLL